MRGGGGRRRWKHKGSGMWFVFTTGVIKGTVASFLHPTTENDTVGKNGRKSNSLPNTSQYLGNSCLRRRGIVKKEEKRKMVSLSEGI